MSQRRLRSNTPRGEGDAPVVMVPEVTVEDDDNSSNQEGEDEQLNDLNREETPPVTEDPITRQRRRGEDVTSETASESSPSPPGTAAKIWQFVESSPPCKVFIFAATVLLCTAIYGAASQLISDALSETATSFDIFSEEFDALTSRYSSQPLKTNQALRLALGHVFETPNPREPPSMIVLVPETLASNSFPQCYVESFGAIVNRVNKRNSPLPVKKMNASSFDVGVTAVHRDLKNYFHSGGLAVVVSGIQDFVSYEHLNVFDAFCDNTHAPEKRAVFLFLVTVPTKFYQSGWEKNLDALANKVLEDAWKHVLDPEKVHPLLARIGSWGVIHLKEGDDCFAA